MSYVFQKVKGGPWYIGFRDEAGAWKKRKSAAQTKEAAKRLAADEEAQCERERLGHSSTRARPHTWDELCARYLTDVVPNRRNTRTPESQMRMHVSAAFAGRALATISAGDVEAWVGSLKTDGKRWRKTLSDSTRETLRARMSAVFRYGVKKLKWLATNPADEAERVRVPKTKPKYLTADEVQRLLAVAKPAMRNLLACAFLTGMRKGELAGLRREDLDFERRIIHVRHSYDGPTKAGREDSVPMTAALVPFLKDELQRHAETWVFPGPRGGMRRREWNAQWDFARLLKAAGIERQGRSWKHTRSTLGTLLYAATGDIRAVQLVLRHSKSDITTTHYAGVLKDHLHSAVEKLPLLASPGLLPGATAVVDAPVSTAAEPLNRASTRLITDKSNVRRNAASPDVSQRPRNDTDGRPECSQRMDYVPASPHGLPGETATKVSFEAVLYVPATSRGES